MQWEETQTTHITPDFYVEMNDAECWVPREKKKRGRGEANYLNAQLAEGSYMLLKSFDVLSTPHYAKHDE